jgi:hypothetical protein
LELEMTAEEKLNELLAGLLKQRPESFNKEVVSENIPNKD